MGGDNAFPNLEKVFKKLLAQAKRELQRDAEAIVKKAGTDARKELLKVGKEIERDLEVVISKTSV